MPRARPVSSAPSASSPKLQHARGHLSEQIPVDPVRRHIPVILLVLSLSAELQVLWVDALAVDQEKLLEIDLALEKGFKYARALLLDSIK